MDLKQYHEIITDSWKYFRSYAEKGQLTDHDWEQAINDANALIDKHRSHHKLISNLLVDMFGELERLNGIKGESK